MTITEVPLTNGDARKAAFERLDANPRLTAAQLSEALGGTPARRQCGNLITAWKAERGPTTITTPVAKVAPKAPVAAPRPRPAKAARAADGTDDRLERWARLLVPWACAGIALVMSYSHVHALGVRAGVAWPELLPLSIDGLMLAGWLCLRRHHRHFLAIAAVALGVVASMALNGIASRPELVAMQDVRLGAALAVPVSAVVAMHLALKR